MNGNAKQAALLSVAVFLLAGCFAKRAPTAMPPPPAARPANSESYARFRAEQERVLLRNGSIDLRAKDVAAAKAEIERIVEQLEGRIDEWRMEEREWIRMTVRVPEPKLEEAMDRVGSLGKVLQRSLSARDVTEEMIDLEARLENLKALRDRLRAYLDRAADLEDIVAVERELVRVQSEIEGIEGRLKVLRDQVTMSKLEIYVKQRG